MIRFILTEWCTILPLVPTELDKVIDSLNLPTYVEKLMFYIAYQLNVVILTLDCP